MDTVSFFLRAFRSLSGFKINILRYFIFLINNILTYTLKNFRALKNITQCCTVKRHIPGDRTLYSECFF